MSLGVVVAGRGPAEAAALVADMADAVPGGSRQEYLVLDDHASAERRDLLDALDGVGDCLRLVPRPSGGRAVEYDALSLSARSEFLVFAFGGHPPLDAIERALGLMWSSGSDALVVLGSTGAPAVLDDGAMLVESLGLGRGSVTADRVVMIRRWVARWIFSESERALDPAEEVADRSRLLGLDLLVLDRNCHPA